MFFIKEEISSKPMSILRNKELTIIEKILLLVFLEEDSSGFVYTSYELHNILSISKGSIERAIKRLYTRNILIEDKASKPKNRVYHLNSRFFIE